MTAERDGDESPEDLMAELGVNRSPGDDDALDLGALDSLRARIADDLEQQQGDFRRQHPLARGWPVALAVGGGIAFALLLSPTTLGPLATLSVVSAGLAAVLAVAAILFAPTRPGLGERVALGALGVGASALALQLAGGCGGDAAWQDALGGSMKCSGVLFGGAVVPLVILSVWVRRTGLPVRALHATGLSVAAFALGGVGIFRHCAPIETWHTLFAHFAAPVVGAALAAFVLHRLLPRRLRG